MRRRYQVKITPAGYILVGLTLAVALAGVNTGHNLLYLSASALLALMTVSGLLSFFNLAFLKVELSPPEEIFAHLPTPFRLRLHGPSYPCFFLRVKTPYGEAMIPYFRKALEVKMWLRFPRRGPQTLPLVEIVSGYPLGFFCRIRKLETNLVLTVYPTPLSGPVNLSFRSPDREARSLMGLTGGEPEDFAELKPYREGMPASRIAWRASARTRELLVKEFEGEAGREVVIHLTNSLTEEILSRAAYLVLSALKEGLVVGLSLPGKEIAPGRGLDHRRRLLEALAYA